MPINPTSQLTQMLLSSMYSYPGPYTFIETTGGDGTGGNTTQPIGSAIAHTELPPRSWTIGTALNGAELDFTVDISAAPQLTQVPGQIYDFPPIQVRFRDNDGIDHWHWHQIRSEFEAQVTVVDDPPVAVDDGPFTVMQGASIIVDTTPNDSDDNAITNVSIDPADWPAGATITEGADGVFTIVLDSATPVGPLLIPYTVEDASGQTDTANIELDVIAFFDIYARLSNAIGGSTISYEIDGEENSVSLMRISDMTIVAVGGNSVQQTYDVPAGEEGEDYWIIDDTMITTSFQVDIDVAANGFRRFDAVNQNIRWLDASPQNNLEEVHFPAQNYPNLTLLEAGGTSLRVLNINGTFPNARLRINGIMIQQPNVQVIRVPIEAEVSGVGGNIAQLNIRNMDTKTAISNNLRAAAGGGDVVGNTLIDLPGGNDYRENVEFVGSTTTGAQLPLTAFATVASQTGSNRINFSLPLEDIGSNVVGGHEFSDPTNPHHISYWIEQLVAAGRDSAPPNFGWITALGIWGGDAGNYAAMGYPASTMLAADALAGQPFGTQSTQWMDTTGASDFRI